MSRLDVNRIVIARREVSEQYQNTPQFLSDGLSEMLGCSVICKVETTNPVHCFKSRGTDWWIQCRKISHVVCASAGNLGQALALCARERGIEVHVFASESANTRKLVAMRRLGAIVHLAGNDFDAAKQEAEHFAAIRGWPTLRDGSDPEISEGLGTIGCELERLSRLDCVYLPIGNGALASGVGSWLKSRRPNVRIVGVCAYGAPSMEQSWRRGEVITTESTQTIADGIAVRIPVAEAVEILRAVVDDIILVSDLAIRQAMRAYLEHESLVAEPAGAVSLAGAMLEAPKNQGKSIATVLTGSNVTREIFEDIVR